VFATVVGTNIDISTRPKPLTNFLKCVKRKMLSSYGSMHSVWTFYCQDTI